MLTSYRLLKAIFVLRQFPLTSCTMATAIEPAANTDILPKIAKNLVQNVKTKEVTNSLSMYFFLTSVIFSRVSLWSPSGPRSLLYFIS